MIICGVDEAGRGCVIGPLVICAATIAKEDEHKLRKLGVKDSKLIPPKKREVMAKILPSIVNFKLFACSPNEIDHNILIDQSSNLNWLEAKKTIELIDLLNPNYAYIDCPSTNPPAYSKYIKERLTNKKVKLIVEHKADVNYLIAAAASILAKVSRDRAIEELKEKIGIDFGSGYMSDSKTSNFLKEYWEKFPELFRHSWAPYKKLKQAKMQKGLFEF